MRGTSLILTAALALCVARTADAHGPTRQKITASVEVNAPAAKVWSVIGNFQDMSWHPAVEKIEGTGGNDAGVPAKRTVTLKGGGLLNEELTRYDADTFTYAVFLPHVDVKILPVTDYSSTITVVPEGPDKSKVEWQGAFYRGDPNGDPPPNLNDAAAIKAVTDFHRAGLDALKQRFGGSS